MNPHPIDTLAAQLWDEFSLPIREDANSGKVLISGRIVAAPYAVSCQYIAGRALRGVMDDRKAAPNIRIAIHDSVRLDRFGTFGDEPLLVSLNNIPFPDNIIRLKKNWDERRELVENNFRLAIVLTRVLSILIPDHMPRQ